MQAILKPPKRNKSIITKKKIIETCVYNKNLEIRPPTHTHKNNRYQQ